jgi:hypothetical protein
MKKYFEQYCNTKPRQLIMLYQLCAVFNNNNNNLIKQNYTTEETAAQIIVKDQLKSNTNNEKIEEIKRKFERLINVNGITTM